MSRTGGPVRHTTQKVARAAQPLRAAFCWMLKNTTIHTLLLVLLMTVQVQALSEYRWKNRLVVVVAEADSPLFSKVEAFRTAFQCEIKDRDILFMNAQSGSSLWKELPVNIKEKRGLYLIGYDGGIKDFSHNDQLLGRLNVVIDQMPMRRRELANRQDKNIC